jgi:hypothetical protein
VGDFPTTCPICGVSYWGTYHLCQIPVRPWNPVPASPPVVVTNVTVDYTWALVNAINRLAEAVEALLARMEEDDGEG